MEILWICVSEGCFLSCGTEIMRKRIPDFKPEIIVASDYYKTKNEYFEIFDMPKEELDIHSEVVALEIQRKYF